MNEQALMMDGQAFDPAALLAEGLGAKKTTRRVCEVDVESEQDQAESEDEDLGEEGLSPNDDEAPEDPEQDTDRDVDLPVRSASYLGRRA